jgi:hypothetical protein
MNGTGPSRPIPSAASSIASFAWRNLDWFSAIRIWVRSWVSMRSYAHRPDVQSAPESQQASFEWLLSSGLPGALSKPFRSPFCFPSASLPLSTGSGLARTGNNWTRGEFPSCFLFVGEGDQGVGSAALEGVTATRGVAVTLPLQRLDLPAPVERPGDELLDQRQRDHRQDPVASVAVPAKLVSRLPVADGSATTSVTRRRT